jgi:hypothetical protein
MTLKRPDGADRSAREVPEQEFPLGAFAQIRGLIDHQSTCPNARPERQEISLFPPSCSPSRFPIATSRADRSATTNTTSSSRTRPMAPWPPLGTPSHKYPSTPSSFGNGVGAPECVWSASLKCVVRGPEDEDRATRYPRNEEKARRIGRNGPECASKRTPLARSRRTP